MKFEEVVTSPMTEQLLDYIKNHTETTTFKNIVEGCSDRTHLYLGEDAVVIPATHQRVFESNFGLKYIRSANRVQFGNWIVYKATDETVANLLKEVEDA